MRVNLNVPFEQKDEAKRLGARWDPARKVWYVVNVEDLTAFARWFRGEVPKPRKERGARPVDTPCTNHSLPACDCDSPPWEDCAHTFELTEEQAAHMAAISA